MPSNVPIEGPHARVYLFILASPADAPYTKGNVLELRGPLEVGGVRFEDRGGAWFAGAKHMGQRRRLRWGEWRVLFWVGLHDDADVRAELITAGVLKAQPA